MICPFCGVRVPNGAIVCRDCGEELPQAVAADNPAAPEDAASGKQTINAAMRANLRKGGCARCGTVNPAGSRFCSACGAPLKAGPAGSPAGTPGAGSPLRTYLIAGVGVLALTFAVVWISRPPEVKGPPEGDQAGHDQSAGANPHGGANGAMPPGHPQIVQPGGATPQAFQALDQARQAYQKNPASDSSALNLANRLYDVGQHAEAVGYYKQYLAKHPDDPDARTDMAFSLYSSDNLDGAITELYAVLARHPKFQTAAKNMALMYIQKGKRDSVLYYLKRTAEIDPNTPLGAEARKILEGLASRDSTGN